MKDQKDNTSTLSLKATYDLIDKAKKLVSKINKGAEEYPEEFSQQARARIEAEKLKARKQLEQRRNQVPWSGGHLPRPADDENLRKFILQVFLVFAREACKVGSQGLWTVERIRLEAEEYLRKFIIKAYSDEGYDKQGRKLEEMTDYYGSIQEGVWWAFKESAEYRQFEQELLAVAEQQARGSPQSSVEVKARKLERLQDSPPSQRREVEASPANPLREPKRRGRHPTAKRDIYEKAATYKEAHPDESWHQVARKFFPDEYSDDPLRCSDRLRAGVNRVWKAKRS